MNLLIFQHQMIRMLDVQELLQQLQGLQALSMISRELRSLDLELRGMMGYQHVYRQQGCDRGLRIDELHAFLLLFHIKAIVP